MNPDEEAKSYIAEMKKRGIRLYRIADMSPEELSGELYVSREIAQRIIELARKEVLKKMEKKGAGKDLQMLPHVGKKRSEILKRQKLGFDSIAEMSPEELMKIVPHLRRYEAEDIIIAAELIAETSKNKYGAEKDPLFKLPYMSVSRRRTLKKHDITISDIARMTPEQLMRIIPGLRREHAERMIISAELIVEGKIKHRSRKAPRPPRHMPQKVPKISTPGHLKHGMVNGNSLVNGRGVVNGLGPPRSTPSRSKIPVLLIMAVVLISALIPMFLFAPSHYITIDGNFEDWKNINGVYDPFGLADGALEEVKGHYSDGTLYVYAKFASSLFTDPEGLFIFIDSDRNTSTGYRVDSIGADYMIKITGWNGTIHQSSVYIYEGNTSDNWTAFLNYKSPKVAFRGGQIEISTNIDSKTTPAFMVFLKKGSGEDSSYVPVTPGSSGAFVYASSIVTNISNPYGFTSIEKINVYPYQTAHLHLYLQPFGQCNNLTYSLRILNSKNAIVSENNWLNVTAASNQSFVLQIKAHGTGTVGFRVVALNHETNVLNNVESAKIGSLKGIKIDGNFEDWNNISGVSDPKGDVEPAVHYIHENIDLKEIKRYEDYFYIQTYAPILAGDVVPEIIERTLPDSDRDTVPDKYDPYPHDFNNDGIPDNESYVVVDGKKLPDVDGDGIPDYPYGPDMWLNTTIPSWFPKPYAGRHVSVYIGPVPKIKVTGNDTFMVFIKNENGSYHAPFLPFASSYMVLISGKGFEAHAWQEHFNGHTWTREKPVNIAYSGTQLEGNATVKGKIFVLALDWLKQRDLENTNYDKPTVTRVNATPSAVVQATATDWIINGTFAYVNTTETFSKIVVENGGTLIFNNNSTLTADSIYVNSSSTVIINGSATIKVSSVFYLDSTSVINADGTGYAGGIGGSYSVRATAGIGLGAGGAGEAESLSLGSRILLLNYGSGGGGGGYGGAGGAGGNCSLSNLASASGGAGGATYGTATGTDIDVGSGGGGGGGKAGGGNGGAGGGAIAIYSSNNISIYGAIYANGSAGGSSIYGGGGGGGSGGGILIYGNNVSLYSTARITATGGNGGNSTYSGGGGAGGGGRIKIFYVESLVNNSYFNVSGGIPGVWGGAGFTSDNGVAGSAGTVIYRKVPELNTSLTLMLFIMIQAFIAVRRNKNTDAPAETRASRNRKNI